MKPTQRIKQRSVFLAYLYVFGIIAFTFIAIQLTSGKPLFDFTAFWIAGRLILTGEDPYLKSDWIPLYEPFNLGLADNQTFLYPTPILPFFLPFALLPLRTASVIWLVLTQVAVVGSIFLLSQLWGEKRFSYLLPFVFGVFIFRSYITTLTLGQLSGFLILILTGVLFLWTQSRWFWGGLVFCLLALKPSLGIPLIGLASLWFLKKRIWKHFYGLASGGVLLLVIGWSIDLQWIEKFIEIGSRKVTQTFGYHPTLWGLAGFLCNRQQECTYWAGGLLAAIFAILFLWLIFQKKIEITATLLLSASIIFSVLLTPYLWVYDQLLLLVPLAVITGNMIQQRRPYLVTALVPLLVSFLSLFLLPVAVNLQNDVWNVLVPMLVLIIFLMTLMNPARKVTITI